MSMDGIGKNKIDLSKLKGGFELKSVLGNSKWESVFRALDSDGNGILDGNEMSYFFELADSDNADGILTGKEAKAFIKGNADLKDAKIKKEDILEFLAKIQENSENIDSVEIVTENGEKTIVIKYKDLDLKQKTFHKNGNYETVSENAQGETVSELRNSEDVLLEKTVKNGETTETTEYEADGTTEAKVTLKEGNNKKTVTNFEQGVPTTRVVNENNTETIYLYNAETKSFDKTKEVLNKGIDALEQTTVFHPNLGVSNQVINKDGAKITTTYVNDEFISRHAVGSNYDEETVWDGTDHQGFVTNRKYKNGDSSVCYSNTEDLNTRTYEKLVINGQTYEAKYDGNGGTYVVVQYGETFKEFCKHMGVSAEELKKANENNPDFHNGRQGATVIVPKYIAPNSNKFINRKPASEVQAMLQRDAQRRHDIRNGEISKTEMTITLQDAKFKRNYNWESHTFPKDMDWKWVAKWLYTKEGAQSYTSEQVAQRAKILADLNPEIKDGEIYGKPIKVKYDTSELEAKEEQRKQVPFTPDSSVHSFRDLAIKVWKMEHPYDMYFDYHNGFEIRYREEVLRKMNPDIKDGELAGKTLQVTVAPTSGSYQVYHTKKTDTEVGQPIISALLKNQGKHSQAKLNALAQITTKEEFESYQRCADGQKKQHGYYKMETWLYLIPEEDRDTFVQKWYKQGILDDNDMINLQANKAYWAIRDACDSLNVFSNSNQIRQAVKLIVDPTGQNNPEYAQKVYEMVDTRITMATRRENIWSGKTFNLKEYINDEFWVFESDRDNYDLNLVAQGAQEIKATPRAGETQQQANSRARIELAAKTFRSATIGGGTNEHSMQDVLKFLKNKEEFEAFKKAIKNSYSWDGYKDAVQYALYDELSLEEIGKMNELMISKGFYEGKDADEVRAYHKVQVLKDGDYEKIENVFKTISSKTEFDLINRQLNGGFVNYVKSHLIRPGQNYNMILASAGKYLSKNDQIDVAYNLLSGNGSLFMNSDTVSLALNCIQSEEVAKAVDEKLRRHNTSIDELRKKFCRNEDTKMADRPLMEAKVPARLSAEQIKQNKETVRIFEEQLADFEARYDAVKDGEGSLSDLIDEFFGAIGVGISNDEIDKLIAYDKETLKYMRLASEGRLDQYRNGHREYISLENLIKLRASNIVRLSGATSVSRTTKAGKVGATNEEIAQMEKDMDILSAENECRASLLTSWNYISQVNSNSSDRDLAKAIEDTIANLNNYSTEDFQISLPINYVFEDGIIKDRLTQKPVDKNELMGIVKNLRKGLSDITKEMLGVEIPTNSSYSKAKEIFNKTFADKKRFVTKTYEKAYGRTMPENILEKHSKYIGYGKMFVQVATTILVTIGTSVATGGSGTALFLTAAGTSLAMNSVDQITSANGITKAEGDEVLVGALFDGLLTFGGFKVGAAAEKFVNGEFKIARTVLAANKNTVRRIAPAISTKSAEKVSIIMARAQAAGFEITSDALQALVQQYCMNGEIDEEGFIMAILMSAGGNTIGHAVSARSDIKATNKKTTTPQGIHSKVETNYAKVFDKPTDNYLSSRQYYKELIPDITDEELNTIMKYIEVLKTDKNINAKDIITGETEIDIHLLNNISKKINEHGKGMTFAKYQEKISGGKDITQMSDAELDNYYRTLVPFISDAELNCLKNQVTRIKNGEPRFLNIPEEQKLLGSIEAKRQAGLRLKGITDLKGTFEHTDAHIPFENKDLDIYQKGALNTWVWTAPRKDTFDGIFDEMSTTVPQDTYLYRGVSIRLGRSIENQVDFLNTIKVGGIIDNSGRYTSTAGDIAGAGSYSSGFSYGQGYMLKIKVPKGTKVIDVRNFDQSIDEFILGSHQLRVTDIDYKTGVVECEYIPVESKAQAGKPEVLKPEQISKPQHISAEVFEQQMAEIGLNNKFINNLSEYIKDADGNIPQDLVNIFKNDQIRFKRLMQTRPDILAARIKSLKNNDGYYTQEALDFVNKEIANEKTFDAALSNARIIKEKLGEVNEHNINLYNDISNKFPDVKEQMFKILNNIPAENQKAIINQLSQLQGHKDFTDIMKMISVLDNNKPISATTIEKATKIIESTDSYTRPKLENYIKTSGNKFSVDDIPVTVKLIEEGLESPTDIAFSLAYIKLNKFENIADINFNELRKLKKAKVTDIQNGDFALKFYQKCLDNNISKEKYFEFLEKYKDNYALFRHDEIQDMIISHPDIDYSITRLNNSKNFFTVTENKPDGLLNETTRYQYMIEENGSLTYLCKETENILRGNTVVKAEYPDGTVKKGYYENTDEALEFANFTLEETIGPNGIRTSRTLSKPSKTEKGVVVTLQEIYDESGNVAEVRELGKLTHYGSQKQGFKIERKYVSPSGIESNHTIINGPKGTYSKFEAAGVEITRQFKKINEDNVTVTQINGEKYNAKFNDNKIEITRTRADGTTEVTILDSELIDLSLMDLYKQLPGDYLFKLKELGIKVKRGYQSNNACYEPKTRTIQISDECANDPFTFAHEFGHVIDYEILGKFSRSKELREVYTKELNKLYKEKPGASNHIISYFTDNTATHLGRSADSGLEELIAEINAITSGLLKDNSKNLQRAKLLQENFPETYKLVAERIYKNYDTPKTKINTPLTESVSLESTHMSVARPHNTKSADDISARLKQLGTDDQQVELFNKNSSPEVLDFVRETMDSPDFDPTIANYLQFVNKENLILVKKLLADPNFPKDKIALVAESAYNHNTSLQILKAYEKNVDIIPGCERILNNKKITNNSEQISQHELRENAIKNIQKNTSLSRDMIINLSEICDIKDESIQKLIITLNQKGYTKYQNILWKCSQNFEGKNLSSVEIRQRVELIMKGIENKLPIENINVLANRFEDTDFNTLNKMLDDEINTIKSQQAITQSKKNQILDKYAGTDAESAVKRIFENENLPDDLIERIEDILGSNPDKATCKIIEESLKDIKPENFSATLYVSSIQRKLYPELWRKNLKQFLEIKKTSEGYSFNIDKNLEKIITDDLGNEVATLAINRLKKTITEQDIENIQQFLNKASQITDISSIEPYRLILLYQNVISSSKSASKQFQSLTPEQCAMMLNTAKGNFVTTNQYNILTKYKKTPSILNNDEILAELEKGANMNIVNPNIKEISSYIATQELDRPVKCVRTEGFMPVTGKQDNSFGGCLNSVKLTGEFEGQTMDEVMRKINGMTDIAAKQEAFEEFKKSVLSNNYTAVNKRFMSCAFYGVGGEGSSSGVHWDLNILKGSHAAFLEGSNLTGECGIWEVLIQHNSKLHIKDITYDAEHNIWQISADVES